MNLGPNIFEYDDYRKFLVDLFAHRKAQDERFSHRVFLRSAGYRSSSMLKHVTQGKRNLSKKSAARFADALQLDGDQSQFFKILVAFNQTDSMSDKQRLAQTILGSRVSKRLNPIHLSKFEFWSHWYHVAISELIRTPQFREDYDWIAAQIVPAITAAQAKAAIECFLRLGLVRREADGKLVLGQSEIVSDSKIVHAAISKFHTSMIQKAKESIDRFNREDRNISSVTLAISDENKSRALEIIKDFQRKMLALTHEEQAADRVYQVNIQLFPLTQRLA